MSDDVMKFIEDAESRVIQTGRAHSVFQSSSDGSLSVDFAGDKAGHVCLETIVPGDSEQQTPMHESALLNRRLLDASIEALNLINSIRPHLRDSLLQDQCKRVLTRMYAAINHAER